MSLNIPVKSIGDTFFATELNEIVVAVDGTTLDNRIVVNQANAVAILGGTIDATKEYFLDGIIDMGSTEITVPSGGINIKGFDFNISGLTSTENNYTMFNGLTAGDLLWQDFLIDVSGTSSKVLDVKSATGNNAFEIQRINFNNCTSLGVLDNYRQGLEIGTGRFGGTPELELKGVWVGGFFIDTSIVRGLTAGSYSLYKAGVGFLMSSRFRSNQNIDLPTNASFFDFAPSNFINPSTVQISSALITRNGSFDATDVNIVPNMAASDLVSSWGGNVGMENTFEGGRAVVTSEIATVISSPSAFFDLAGTWTVGDLQHFDSPANGQLRHLGTDPREYKLTSGLILESTANNDLRVKVVKWDDSASGFVDVGLQARQVNALSGGRNVAFFTIIINMTLDQNDYVKLQVSNETGANNITAELTSAFIVEER